MSTTTRVSATSAATESATTERRRRDPVTAALIVIVAATVLIRPSAAAPTNKNLAADFDSWWYNACGHHGEHRPSRHNHKDNCADLGITVPKNSKIQVRRQMKIFISDFQKELRTINNTYSKVMKPFEKYTQPAFEWLPKFKKPAKNSKVVLVKYHEDLQKYVVAVHYLATLEVDAYAEIEWQNKRAHLLTKLSNSMKGLLCEIETAVNATCQTVPARIPASFAQEKGLHQRLPGVTDLIIVDSAVLSRFHTFIKQSSKLVKFLPVFKESDIDDSEDNEETTLSAEADGE